MKNLPRLDLHSIFIHLIPFLLFSSLVDRSLCAPAVEGDDVDGGCYYMFNHYGEGDRIFTNEPCLNCTCHNSMLMCYLRVCPFTKPIGQDCTIEKKPDQCCPLISCPEVPVSLETPSALISSTTPATTTSLATMTDSTDLAHYERGCNIEGKFYPDGAQVEGDPTKPCELCYCIRNRTACVMQECILHVEGCQPVFQPGVCCPVRYKCDYPLQITDETTVSGLITTTIKSIFTSTPVPGGCVRDGEYYTDGSQIPGAGPCEHCYCMRGEAVCAVQECGAPLENAGGNCTAIAPPPGMCCPEKYSCDGDKLMEDESSTTIVPSDDIVGVTQPEIAGAQPSEEPASVSDDEISEKVITTYAPQPEQQTTSVPSTSSENVVSSSEEPQAPETATSSPVPEKPSVTPTTSDQEDEEAVDGTVAPIASQNDAVQPSSDSESEPAGEQLIVSSTEAPSVPTTINSIQESEDTSPSADSTEVPEENATTQSHNIAPETSSESENLVTSSTDNILTQLLTSSPKPVDKEVGETSSLETSSEKPEVTTLGSASESDEGSTSIVPSGESSSTESGGTSTEASVETGSTESSTDISAVGQPLQKPKEPLSDSPTPPESTSIVPTDGVKDGAVEIEGVLTIKPVDDQETSPEVTTIAIVPSHSDDVPESDAQPSPSTPAEEESFANESDKEKETPTTFAPTEEKISESTDKQPTGQEDEGSTPSSVLSGAEESKGPEMASATTPTDLTDEVPSQTPLASVPEGSSSQSPESSPESTDSPVTQKPEVPSSEASVTDVPLDVSSSTTESVAEKEDKVSTSTRPETGEVVGEMHASSTPEPAESLSMQSSTTSAPVSLEDENEISDAQDKVSDESHASSTPESVTHAKPSEPFVTQQTPVDTEEADKETATDGKTVQAVEKATEQPKPVVAPGEQLGEDEQAATVTTTSPVSDEPSNEPADSELSDATPTESAVAPEVEPISPEPSPASPVESESTTVIPETSSETDKASSIAPEESEKTTTTPIESGTVSDGGEESAVGELAEKVKDVTTQGTFQADGQEDEATTTASEVSKPDVPSPPGEGQTTRPDVVSSTAPEPSADVADKVQTTKAPQDDEDTTIPVSDIAVESPEAQITEQPESSTPSSSPSQVSDARPSSSTPELAESVPTTVSPEGVEAQPEKDQPSQDDQGESVLPTTSQAPSDVAIAGVEGTTRPADDQVHTIVPEEESVPTTSRPMDQSEDTGATVQPPSSVPEVSDMKDEVASEIPATTPAAAAEEESTKISDTAPVVVGVETPEEPPIKIQEDTKAGSTTISSVQNDEAVPTEAQPGQEPVVSEGEEISTTSSAAPSDLEAPATTSASLDSSDASEAGEQPVKDEETPEAGTTISPPVEQPVESASEASAQPDTPTTVSTATEAEGSTSGPVKDVSPDAGKEPEETTTLAPGIANDEKVIPTDVATPGKEPEETATTSAPSEAVQDIETSTPTSSVIGKEPDETVATTAPEIVKETEEKVTTVAPDTVKEPVTTIPESETDLTTTAPDTLQDQEEKVASPSPDEGKKPEETFTTTSPVQPEEKIGTSAPGLAVKPIEVANDSVIITTTTKPVDDDGSEDIGVTVEPSSSPDVSDMKDVPPTTETALADDGSTEDEPSGVPGEGNCYVEGKTYKNGSSIPPTTPCHIVCACQNSIVHCLLVHCNPPPSDTGDCKPIYKQGVCCPAYDCEDAHVPTVTVTPGPILTNETVVTVTPETPSAETSESSEEPRPQPVADGETTITPVSSTEGSESSGVSSSTEDGTGEEISKPAADDIIESASPGAPTTTAASLMGDSESSETPAQPVHDDQSSVVATGEGPAVEASSETPSSTEPSSSPVPIVDDILQEHHVEDGEQNVTSTEVTTPIAPGSLYPVTTTTTVTPSSAPWPYPSSTPSPMMTAGACLFDGRVYMSAQQIPRDDPCDFCFCFRGDIICLQQSCPPPIPGCYEEPIPGFCCPRYECPVGNGNATTQGPLFPPSYYHNQILNGVASAGSSSGAIAPSLPAGPGCEVQGEYYESGQIITATSGPCLECRCGSTGMMECDPRECQPEPMLRKMIAAITSR